VDVFRSIDANTDAYAPFLNYITPFVGDQDSIGLKRVRDSQVFRAQIADARKRVFVIPWAEYERLTRMPNDRNEFGYGRESQEFLKNHLQFIYRQNGTISPVR
jgi:hypothetical protein